MTPSVSVTRAKLAYHLEPQLWPRQLQQEPTDAVYDVYSDGEDTFVLFPWNANTRDMHIAGWRADSTVHGEGKLWQLIQAAHDTASEVEEKRYRGAWLVNEPKGQLVPVTQAFPQGNVGTKSHELAEKIVEPANTITQGDVLYVRADVIRRVAGDYAEANGWCNEVNNALSDMGIDGGVLYRRTVRAQLFIDIEVECSDDDMEEAVQALLPERLTLVRPDAGGEASVVLNLDDTEEI